MKQQELKCAVASMRQLAKDDKLYVMVKTNDGWIERGHFCDDQFDENLFCIEWDCNIIRPIPCEKIYVIFFFHELEYDVFDAYDKIKTFHAENKTHHFRLMNAIAFDDDPDEIKAKRFLDILKTDIPTLFDMKFNYTETEW